MDYIENLAKNARVQTFFDGYEGYMPMTWNEQRAADSAEIGWMCDKVGTNHFARAFALYTQIYRYYNKVAPSCRLYVLLHFILIPGLCRIRDNQCDELVNMWYLHIC